MDDNLELLMTSYFENFKKSMNFGNLSIFLLSKPMFGPTLRGIVHRQVTCSA